MITSAGVSHHTAALNVREQLTVSDEAAPPLLKRAHAHFKRGAALLTTCNRLELYVGGEHAPADIHAFLADALGVQPPVVARHMRVRHGADAIRHLYGVASGIDSMVLGETEVLGQVRSAFSRTVAAETDDAVISRLFHTAIRTGRRARTETAISTHALSVSSIAAQQARTFLNDLGRATVLVIGAGEAAQLAAQAMAAQGVHDILVTNRTLANAEALAAELGGQALPFEALPDALASAHVVVSASAAPTPLVDAPLLASAMAQRDGAPLLVVDIGMPRDFDAAVRDLPGVAYHDLDALQTIADRNAEARRGEVEAVQAIVEEETARFLEWWEQLQIVPTISALTERAEALRRAEVAKTMRRLHVAESDRAHVEELTDVVTRAVVKQLLADPIHVLRERGDRDTYLDAVQALFRLRETAGETR